MKVPEMDEKCIVGSKAQAVGATEERVSDNDNRRTYPRCKGRKESPSATVARKEPPVPNPLGKVSAEMSHMATPMPSEVPSVATLPLCPPKSPYVSC